jgi:Uma2 family endonuclease
MSVAARLVTADELFRMPEGSHCELLDGELHEMTPAGFEHGFVIGEVHGRIWTHVVRHGLGIVTGAETGYLVSRDPDTVLAPDVAFVEKARVLAVGIPKSYFPEAPSLMAEVISPGDTVDKVDDKIQRWLAAGVKSAWVVHPGGRSVTVYRSPSEVQVFLDHHILEEHALLPGFQCRVGDLFAPLKG